MSLNLTDGQTLSPDDIQDLARRLREEAGDSQETLALSVGRSQAAVSKALRAGGSPETRYVKVCIDVIEHYCDGVTIDYPRGEVRVSS